MLNLFYSFTTPTKKGPWKKYYEKNATVAFNLKKTNQIDAAPIKTGQMKTGQMKTDQIELDTLLESNHGEAVIHNFRRARYDSSGEVTEINWSNRKININNLKSVWYGISVFSSPGLAHTFLSFDFGEEDPVVISVEARMRPEQSYSPWKGLLDRYHLIYVIADEQDIIGVRTHKRLEEVYFMPINVEKKRRQQMFIDMIERANSLDQQPEFYNTLTSNCTNSIMKETAIPAWQYYLDPRIILSGFSDRIAYKYGVLDQSYSRDVLRKASHIQTGSFSDDDPDFYKKIRENYYQKLNELEN